MFGRFSRRFVVDSVVVASFVGLLEECGLPPSFFHMRTTLQGHATDRTPCTADDFFDFIAAAPSCEDAVGPPRQIAGFSVSFDSSATHCGAGFWREDNRLIASTQGDTVLLEAIAMIAGAVPRAGQVNVPWCIRRIYKLRDVDVTEFDAGVAPLGVKRKPFRSEGRTAQYLLRKWCRTIAMLSIVQLKDWQFVVLESTYDNPLTPRVTEELSKRCVDLGGSVIWEDNTP